MSTLYFSMAKKPSANGPRPTAFTAAAIAGRALEARTARRKRIKALINVDMIGDKSLNIKQEPNSNRALRRLIWTTAADLGYSHAYFFIDTPMGPIEDDHLAVFLKIGVPVDIDIIDFDYAPWHEDDDTMEKLSAKSLEIVGAVMLESIKRLERAIDDTIKPQFDATFAALCRSICRRVDLCRAARCQGDVRAAQERPRSVPRRRRAQLEAKLPEKSRCDENARVPNCSPMMQQQPEQAWNWRRIQAPARGILCSD